MVNVGAGGGLHPEAFLVSEGASQPTQAHAESMQGAHGLSLPLKCDYRGAPLRQHLEKGIMKGSWCVTRLSGWRLNSLCGEQAGKSMWALLSCGNVWTSQPPLQRTPTAGCPAWK